MGVSAWGGFEGWEQTYPKEYLAWTSCLRPVLAPPVAMKAGGMHVIMAKNRITRAASLRHMPKVRVASMPVGILLGVSPVRHGKREY